MKKIKLIILIMLVITVSGCKIRSDVSLSYDGKVIEKVTITESKEENQISEQEYSGIIDTELKNYKMLIDYRDYEHQKINNKNSFGLQFQKKYDNICSYFQDTLFNQYIYRHISCKEDEVFIIIENDTPILEREDLEGYSDPPDFSDIKFTVSLPVKAYQHNADEVKENTYIWNFDNIPEGKNIELKINKNDLKQANLENQKLIKKKQTTKIISIIIIVAGIIIVGAFVASFLHKKYKENQIEY